MMGLPEYLELFGEKTVPLVLIALGLVVAGGDDGAEVARVTGMTPPEYVGTMAFAALLVVMGCLERMVQLRSARAPRRPRPRRRRDVADRLSISSVQPSSGTAGTLVRITGHNLASVTDVAFNGHRSMLRSIGATYVDATVPSGATSGRITVTTPAGTATSDVNFTVVPDLKGPPEANGA